MHCMSGKNKLSLLLLLIQEIHTKTNISVLKSLAKLLYKCLYIFFLFEERGIPTLQEGIDAPINEPNARMLVFNADLNKTLFFLAGHQLL